MRRGCAGRGCEGAAASGELGAALGLGRRGRDGMAAAGGGGAAAGRAYSFKVVLLGEGCVGKTSLVLRYCENKFNDKHITTLQVRAAGAGAASRGPAPPRLRGLCHRGPLVLAPRSQACPLRLRTAFAVSPWEDASSGQPGDGTGSRERSGRALKSPQGPQSGCACGGVPVVGLVFPL